MENKLNDKLYVEYNKLVQGIPYSEYTNVGLSTFVPDEIGYIVKNTDIGLRQMWNGSKWITIDNNTYTISQKEDLPEPITGTIELEEHKTYLIVNMIDLGTDNIVLNNHTTLEGINSFEAGFTYSGTGIMFNSTDSSFKIKNMTLVSSGKFFNFTNIGRNKHIIFEHLAFVGSEMGTIEGYGAVDFDICNYTDVANFHIKDVLNMMFTRQFANISNPISYNYTSSQTSTNVSNDEVVLFEKQHGVGTEKYLYKNIFGSIITIDDNTDYTIDTNWEVINKSFFIIEDTSQTIYKIQATHCKFNLSTGYIGIKGDENNIDVNSFISFVGNTFDGDGIFIDGIDINSNNKFIFSTNFGISTPTRLPKKTTNELNEINNPGIGFLLYNTDEKKVVVYTSDGWVLLDNSLMYLSAYSNDFETDLGGFTLINDSTNYWVRNTDTASTGAYSLYITDNGINSQYTNTSQVSHAYVDVPIPSGIASCKLQFDWKAEGEVGYDYLRVYKTPNSYTPSVGSLPSSSYQIGNSQYNNQTIWTTDSIDLGTSDAGTTVRIIFSWNNDSSVANNPAACIDNVKLQYTN